MKIVPTLDHRRVRVGRKLKGLGEQQNLLERPQIVFELAHEIAQQLHQLGMIGILGLDILIRRLNHPLAHHPLPHPIGDHRRKLIIGLVHHPIGQLLPTTPLVLAIRHPHHFAKGRLARDDVSRLAITILIVRRQGDPPRAITPERKPIDGIPQHTADVVVIGHVFVSKPQLGVEWLNQLFTDRLLTMSEGRQFIKIMTLGLAERIIMALRALHPLSEKDPHGVGKIVERHAEVPRVITHRRSILVPTITRRR